MDKNITRKERILIFAVSFLFFLLGCARKEVRWVPPPPPITSTDIISLKNALENIEKAEALELTGKEKEALTIIDSLFQKGVPGLDRGYLYFKRANLLFLLKRYKEAKGIFLDLARTNSYYMYPALLHLGIIALKEKRFKDAEKYLVRVKIENLSPYAKILYHNSWITILKHKGRLKDIVYHLVQLRNLTPPFENGLYISYLKNIIHELSISDLESLKGEYKKEFPGDIIRFRLSELYIAQAEEDKAAEILKELTDLFPNSDAPKKCLSLLKNIPSPQHKELIYKIGCLLPLSGPHAWYGESVLKGLQLAAGVFSPKTKDEVSMEIVIRDIGAEKADPELLFKELSEQHDIKAVVALLNAPFAQKVAHLADQEKLPVIIFSQLPDLTKQSEYVFRLFLTPESQIRPLVTYAMDTLHLKEFATLYPENEYGKLYSATFSKIVNEKGGEVLATISFSPKKTDFKEEIERLSRESLDLYQALFIPAGTGLTKLIVPQLVYHDIKDILLMGTTKWNSEELIKEIGRYLEGAIFPALFYPTDSRPSVQKFITDFKAIYNEQPNYLMALGYDSGSILKEIFYRNKDISRSELPRVLKAINLEGAIGKISFNNTGDMITDLYLFQIKDMKVIPLNVDYYSSSLLSLSKPPSVSSAIFSSGASF